MKQTIIKWVSRWYIGPLFSGLIVALACVHYHSGILVCIGLVPLIEFLYAHKQNRRKLILGMWYFGLVLYAIILAWIVTARVEHLLELGDAYKNSIRVFVWLTTTLILSASYALAGLAISLLKPFASMRRLLITLPCIWILASYAGTIIFSLGTWGPGSGLEDVYAYGHIEFPAAVTPLVYVARLFGTYGLALAVVALNSAIWYSLRARSWKPAIITAGTLIIMSGIGYAVHPPAQKDIHAAVQQKTSIGLTGMDGLRTSARTLRGDVSPGTSSDVLILPEYGSVFGGNGQKAAALIRSITHATDPLVVYGDAHQKNAYQSVNTVTASTASGRTLHTQEKTFRMPNGEYLPAYTKATAQFLGLSEAVKKYVATTRGTASYIPYEHNGVRYGILFCSAAVAPTFYQRVSHNGAEVLTNSGSFAFSTSSIIHGHVKQALRLNAVANAKPMLVSMRGGHAYIINYDGAFVAHTRDIDNALLRGTVQPTKGKTPYSQLGEYMLIVAAVALAAAIYTGNKREQRRN